MRPAEDTAFLRCDLHARQWRIAVERRPGPAVQAFVPVDYPLPADLVSGRQSISIRVETRCSDAPVYECRVLEA